jgi:hypothetical protein
VLQLLLKLAAGTLGDHNNNMDCTTSRFPRTSSIIFFNLYTRPIKLQLDSNIIVSEFPVQQPLGYSTSSLTKTVIRLASLLWAGQERRNWPETINSHYDKNQENILLFFYYYFCFGCIPILCYFRVQALGTEIALD